MTPSALRWVPAALWAGLIWFSSSFDWRRMPFELSFGSGGGLPFQLPDWLPPDKFFHAEIYLILALFVRSPMRMARGEAFVVTVVLAALWGVIDEFHQSFVPGRFADPWDALADLAGATIGAAALALWLDLIWPRIVAAFAKVRG